MYLTEETLGVKGATDVTGTTISSFTGKISAVTKTILSE